MWDRKAIKERAKIAFKENYWRCVLVALIMAALVGGGSSAGRDRVKNATSHLDNSPYYSIDIPQGFESYQNDIEDIRDVFEELDRMGLTGPTLALFAGAMSVFALFAIAIDVLLINPLNVSCANFFVRNADRPADLGELKRGFTPEWLHNVVTLLLRDLFLFLWSLLLVVPGIIKAYSYRMVPYIMADHPEMSGTEAITLSRAMMDGHKWNAFVYDLSFIGWYLLTGITAGIAGLFYVFPYKSAADAELYRAISAGFSGGAGAPTTLPEF